jgi:hypothetical protein
MLWIFGHREEIISWQWKKEGAENVGSYATSVSKRKVFDTLF